MRQHTFRQRVSESMVSLPILSVLVAVLWMLPNIQNVALWIGLGIVGIMTYLVIAWNTQYQLLRVRSRMNSLSFLFLFAVFPELHAVGWHLFPAACLLGAYFLLFRAYGTYAPQGYLFHAFFLLSLGSVAFPPLLFLLPFFLFSAGRHLRALTGKSMLAALFGIVLPYWVLVPLFLFAREVLQPYLSLWQPDCLWEAIQLAKVPLDHWVGGALFLLISVIAVVHFLRTAYNDKIRTRQYHYFLLLQAVPLVVLLVFLPQYFATTLSLLIVTLTPFIGHYFALAKGRGMNAWFITWIVLFSVFGLFNYLDLWTLFFPIS